MKLNASLDIINLNPLTSTKKDYRGQRAKIETVPKHKDFLKLLVTQTQQPENHITSTDLVPTIICVMKQKHYNVKTNTNFEVIVLKPKTRTPNQKRQPYRYSSFLFPLSFSN